MSAIAELVEELAAQGVTKAVTVRQPYASLIVHGIKLWETRPAPFGGLVEGVRALPGCKIEPGERIAIHAAAKGVTRDFAVGFNDQFPRSDVELDEFLTNIAYVGLNRRTLSGMAVAPIELTLPLGAVVGTVKVVAALPIHDEERLPSVGLRYSWEPHVTVSDGVVAKWRRRKRVVKWRRVEISDQLPFGYWEDGNWAMRLEDPTLVAPVACKGFQGVWSLDRAVKAAS